MRIRLPSFLLLSLALLTGCAAQSPEAQTPPSTQAPSAQPQPSQPAAPVATPTPTPADTHERAPVAQAGFDPAAPERSCKTDSDCAVKDVGNCCGYYPMCVSKDARTDPAAVQAQCAKSGMASICGFQEVKGCQCVQGRCENVADGAAVM